MGVVTQKQTSTLFNFSVDVSFSPEVADEEAGVSVVLTQFQHFDLGIVNLPDGSNDILTPKLRFRVEASGKPDMSVPETTIISIPEGWPAESIRLSVTADSDTEFAFSARHLPRSLVIRRRLGVRVLR